MARKQRSKSRGPGGPQAQGAPARAPQGGGGAAGPGGGGGTGWGPLRDSIRRDVEQAISSLAFAERLHQKLDTQRRVFLDFPRAMEQLRSGALERVAVALSRIYEGGQGFDLQRFLRDLPTALAHLAAADRSKSAPPPAEAGATATAAAGATAGGAASPGAEGAATPDTAEAAAAAPPAEAAAPPAEAAAPPAPAQAAVAEPAGPVNPRLELRAKLLAAAPHLAKAATSYRRNVATLKRAALARRSPGPWRADREVLEEARRAVEFVEKLYDTYAEAWADQPLTKGLHEQTTAELDRFLAWTQLDRYVELAVMASTNAPRPPKPGQQVFGSSKECAPPPTTEGSPGAGGTAAPDTASAVPADAAPDTAGASTPPEESAKPQDPPAAEAEPGHA